MLIKHLPFTQALLIDYFTVVNLVAKPLIWIEGDLVVIESSIWGA